MNPNMNQQNFQMGNQGNQNQMGQQNFNMNPNNFQNMQMNQNIKVISIKIIRTLVISKCSIKIWEI